jgi:hypothetical protein
MTINVAVLLSPSPLPLLSPLSLPDRRRRPEKQRRVYR